MSGVRNGARSVLKWFAAFYVVAIIVEVFLAGEGIFGLKNIEHSNDATRPPRGVSRTPRRSIRIARSAFF